MLMLSAVSCDQKSQNIAPANNDRRTAPKRRIYFSFGSQKIYFTLRESESMACLLKGMTVKQAAAELKLSHRTVECYVNTIKQKLGCHKKRQLIELIKNTDFLTRFRED